MSAQKTRLTKMEALAIVEFNKQGKSVDELVKFSEKSHTTITEMLAGRRYSNWTGIEPQTREDVPTARPPTIPERLEIIEGRLDTLIDTIAAFTESFETAEE
ncbi:hypothetical protein N9980_00845 [bacterium]|nr:hypothetical protein [bacterium]